MKSRIMVPKLSLYLGSTLFLQNMWVANISFKLLLLLLITAIKTQADSAACEQKEKHLAILDLAKESISKAKDLQPVCVNESKDISSNSSECGAKEKVSAYLDIAKNLIEEAKSNYSACDTASNLTKVVLLHKKPTDCSEILENGEKTSGEYMIWPRNRIFNDMQLKVYCDMDTDDGGWTVIQRRGNFSTKIDFYRTWSYYKDGFGNISEEFWIGNDNIFGLTNQGNYIVRFDMENVDKEYRFATYSSFWIEDETAGYMVHFGNYTGTADEPRSGRPIEVDCEQLKQIIDQDRNVSTRTIALELEVCQKTIVNDLKRINLAFKFNRWVPHELTAEDKRKRKSACLALLRNQRKEKILDRIVTCDENWVYYNNTRRKGGWSALGESAGSVARRALTNKKVFLCFWWDCQGIIYKKYLKIVQTINSAIYSNMLIKVRDAIREKRRNKFRRKVVLFHQDNARPHVSTMAGWTLYRLEWNLIQHPPYSTDMEPSDLCLFLHLPLHLDGVIFNSN
ncbi:Histone-lysine N-methyltransferase SETMAR [Araneus ventricosus]|uniref:Histone-lysine N-methyltransferase SETMAR n=1 Tax=Araneus ventricosus TaxID=182803 RepID=A0A4Y2G3C6_ARAVE|nr:Histone-lysine N-methyltransferase SETMAR [Araneus ventricosus]